MTLDPNVLRESFELIIDRRPDLTICFHQILRERYPALAPMFRCDPTARAKVLARAIAEVIDHLDDLPPVHLARRAEPSGVAPVVCAQLGEALLATLAAIAAEAWSPEVETQWSHACSAVVARILDAGPSIAKAA
ncbi:MAG: globin domain-containing protein [Acidobacteriota bacterium]